ncbi:MAG: plectin [Hominimerdicola sp.]
MAETRFIKTVAFGGYDRMEVIKRLEFLNNQIFDLKNELRETKLLMEEYKKGTDEEKAHEMVLAGEKVKLTSLQVQNETLAAKIKVIEQENQELNKKNESLSASVDELTKSLTDAKDKLAALQAGDSTKALTDVFIKAQKSANDIVELAEKEALNIENNSKTVAQEVIEQANETAASIIYEAEKKAALKDAESKNKAEEMKVASGNLKAVMYEEVKSLKSEFDKIRAAFDAFEKEGIARCAESEKTLAKTEKILADGGVPVFKNPNHIEAKIPEPPISKKIQKSEKAEQNNAKLEKLQKMADAAANGIKMQDDNSKEKAVSSAAPKTAAKKKVNLADLAKQAEALSKK